MKKILFLMACILLSTAKFGAAEDISLEGNVASGIFTTDTSIFTQNECNVLPGSNVVLEASYIVLKPGFSAFSGSHFQARLKDDDGLPNDFELQYFGDLNHGPEEDPDGDLISNADECRLGFNPTVSDKDNDDDGMDDWWEIQYFSDIRALPGQDDDGDGVLNLAEFRLKSNPLLNDLPGTGLHYEYDALGRIQKIYRIPRP
jgi:hypothetical protein